MFRNLALLILTLLALNEGSIALKATSLRGPIWKPENEPKSSLLSLKHINKVIIPENAETSTQKAAEDLCEILELHFEEKVSVTKEQIQKKTKNTIQLELHASRRTHFGGFRILSTGSRLKIQSSTEAGLRNGIYTLCNDSLGAYWFWPSPIGFELVGTPQTRFHKKFHEERPSFRMRHLHPPDREFGRRNRLSPRYNFKHALADIFDKAAYKKHPEAFSLIDGQSRMPKSKRGRALDPQPNLVHPISSQIAADAAIDAFEKHTSLESYSLSINDNLLFDESEMTLEAVAPVSYFRNRPNYTDLVFGFTNRAAEIVFENPSNKKTSSGRPRFITALAYYWAEQSPSFEIHPQVMPILTSDRAQWHDPKYRQEDKALIKRWSHSGAKQLATWDYYYGAPYPYPRQFNQWIAESIPFLSKHGVTAFFSQLPATWGHDGPKAWLTAELLWNPKQDASALLDFYYSEFFGAAAPHIKAFYELAEEHRNQNAGPANWIKNYKSECGIELFPHSVLKTMRSHLNAALHQVPDTSIETKRVQVVSDAFTFTELYSNFHNSRNELVTASISALNGRAIASDTIFSALKNFEFTRQNYYDYSEALIKNPLHKHFSHFIKIRQSDPIPLALSALAQTSSIDYSAKILNPKNAELYKASRTAFRNPESLHSQVQNKWLSAADKNWQPDHFLKPPVPVIENWFYTFWPAQHIRLQTETKDDGSKAGLKITGADSAKAFTKIRTVSGYHYMLDLEVDYQISPDNRTLLILAWKDRFGNVIESAFPLSFPKGKSIGPTKIRFPIKAPPRSDELQIAFDLSRQYPGDHLSIHKTDVSLILE